MDTSQKLDFFKKPNKVDLQCHDAAMLAEKAEGDVLMIDVESLIAADKIRNRLLLLNKLEMLEPNGFPIIMTMNSPCVSSRWL